MHNNLNNNGGLAKYISRIVIISHTNNHNHHNYQSNNHNKCIMGTIII